jgi:hypothetical protein
MLEAKNLLLVYAIETVNSMTLGQSILSIYILRFLLARLRKLRRKLRKLQIVGLELETDEQIFISRRFPAVVETNTAILTDVKRTAEAVSGCQSGARTESNIPVPHFQHKTRRYRARRFLTVAPSDFISSEICIFLSSLKPYPLFPEIVDYHVHRSPPLAPKPNKSALGQMPTF